MTSATGAAQIEDKQASALAKQQLATSAYPPLSELSGTYYVLENIHQDKMNSPVHHQKDTTSSSKDRRSPSNVEIAVQEHKIPGVTGHANVSIIVHNDFEKASSTEKIGGMSAGDKTTKVSKGYSQILHHKAPPC